MPDLTIIYLTASLIPKKFANYQRKVLLEAAGDYPIISLSREPLDFGTNFLQIGPKCLDTIYRELLRGAKLAQTPYVAVAEDDTLYPREHFNFYRPDMDTFAYNQNRLALFTWGVPTYSWRNRKTNATLIAPRALLIEALEERFAKWPNGIPENIVGEVGRPMVERNLKVTLRNSIEVFSEVSVIQINHDAGSDDRVRRHRKKLGPIKAFDVPFWGKAEEILKNCQSDGYRPLRGNTGLAPIVLKRGRDHAVLDLYCDGDSDDMNKSTYSPVLACRNKILDLPKLVAKHKMNISGVIHIGAHFGEENKTYDQLNIKDRLFFEPLESNFSVLKKRIAGRFPAIKKALGNDNRPVKMFVEKKNRGQSCSLLKPVLHLQQYPQIIFDGTETVEMARLDDLKLNLSPYNMISVDVQGYELEVFRGAKETLKKIDYIVTELNRAELYENCAQVEQLIDFLTPYGFDLVEEAWVGETWGDGLFIKKTHDDNS